MTKKRKGKPTTVILVVAFIVGVAIMLYPSLSNLWNAQYQKRLISTYEEDTEALVRDEVDYEYELEKARAYNDTLWPTTDPEDFKFLDKSDPTPEYMDCLNIGGNGVMGYVSIPKIEVELQIYHTTDGDGMNHGAGHLEGTSLPIGGTNTHSVIAAHRGLPGARLFTDLDKMEEGDHFYIHIFDDILAYEVDQIKVVGPEEVSDLVIQEGEDFCTLLTCTPYGVNTDRLLVRGHRVPYEGNEEENEEGMHGLNMYQWLFIIALCVTAAGVTFLIINRHRKKATGA